MFVRIYDQFKEMLLAPVQIGRWSLSWLSAAALTLIPVGVLGIPALASRARSRFYCSKNLARRIPQQPESSEERASGWPFASGLWKCRAGGSDYVARWAPARIFGLLFPPCWFPMNLITQFPSQVCQNPQSGLRRLIGRSRASYKAVGSFLQKMHW